MSNEPFGPNTAEEGKALRYSDGKIPLSHILDFPRSMVALAEVAEYGARKYSRGNFQKGQHASVTVDCMLRHLYKWWAGEDMDPESGCHHLGHAAWNMLVLLEDMIRATERPLSNGEDDDRTFTGKFEDAGPPGDFTYKDGEPELDAW